jgi:hypothetical protein
MTIIQRFTQLIQLSGCHRLLKITFLALALLAKKYSSRNLVPNRLLQEGSGATSDCRMKIYGHGCSSTDKSYRYIMDATSHQQSKRKDFTYLIGK